MELGLTARQLEVLTLVASGLSTESIARELFVTPSTVSAHVRHILDTLGARNRPHAVAIASSAGLISIDERAIPRHRGRAGAELRRALDVRTYREVFESLPHAVVVVDGTGRVAAHNAAARDLFGARFERPAPHCCDLVGCAHDGDQQPLGDRCLTAAVTDLGRPLDGVNCVVDGRYVEVTVVPLSAVGGAVLHCEATTREAAWHADGRSLRITALGPLRLEYRGASLGGGWLDHRPGQLLKYLICKRGQRVPVEELAETLWGSSGRGGLTSLRQAVHGLRDRLEPERPKHAPSRFVVARANAYELDTRHIVVDADVFEREALAVLQTQKRSNDDKAEAKLAHLADMYRAEFLADEPYAEWALAERNRLRSLATRVLRALAETQLARGQLADASRALQRLADLEPLDLDAQRDLISLLLRQRRHADAARQYELARRQFKCAFGQEPDFTLADLAEPGAIAT